MTAAAPLFLAAINHLLAQSSWARDRLIPHAGRHACLDLAPLAIAFSITDSGTLTASAAETEPEVTLSLPLGEAFTTAGGGLPALMAKVHISGSADLADALGFVFRHLRWDAEEDLARLVGDIAAHRLAAVGKKLARAPRKLASTVADSLGDHLGKESAPLVARAEGEGFAAEIQAFETRLAKLEERVGRIKE
jgi:ubiquinone biosynthesis protein UbiJ